MKTLYDIAREKGFTSVSLANSLSLSQPTTWRLLNGRIKKIDFRVIKKISDVLGISEKTFISAYANDNERGKS